MDKFTQTKLSLTRFEPKSPTFDEVWGFTMFIGCLHSEPEESFEDHAKKYLHPDKINYLEEKFPRSNYRSTSEWAKALTSEILSVLLPAVPGFKTPEPGTQVDDALESAARQWRADLRVAGGMVYAREILEYNFEQTERLEARIIRQIRVCTELKAREEVEKAKEEAEKAKKKMRSKT